MKAIGLIVMFGIAAAIGCGCGSGSDPPQIDADAGADLDAGAEDDAMPELDARPAIDASDVDADTGCNPVTQTGCLGGEKCTWITITTGVGEVGCVPDGFVELGGACFSGPHGETTGYDDCLAGTLCIGGECKEICTRTPDSCPATTSTCSSYSGLFTGASQATGACDFTCNPGNKVRKFDGAPECGSADVFFPDKGCYGYFDQVPYSCTPAISGSAHGEAPLPVNPAGNPFLNSCAPGYQLFQAVEGSSATVLCIATCVPEEQFTGTGRRGGVPPDDLAGRGVTAEFTCMYIHFWYGAGAEATAGNVNGIAFNPLGWAYDPDGTGPGPETAFPQPETLRNCDDVTDDTCNAAWGYAPFAVALTATGTAGERRRPFTLVPMVPLRRDR